MSLRADLTFIVFSVVAASTSIQAQTIADYSRAQRTALENAMVQATARSAGLAASAPAISAAPVPVPPPMPAPSPRSAQEPIPAASPRVSGTFASTAGVVVEVDVSGTPYLLREGQIVPGTGWRVESAAVERVVLSRRDSPAAGSVVEAARRVFSLPPLR